MGHPTCWILESGILESETCEIIASKSQRAAAVRWLKLGGGHRKPFVIDGFSLVTPRVRERRVLVG
jgi:hypothetical protein